MSNCVHDSITPSCYSRSPHHVTQRGNRRYTGYINTRMRGTGHLWQGRFGSVVMDEEDLANAVRYVSLNPVRARLVARVQE